jgi:hypothetical protein
MNRHIMSYGYLMTLFGFILGTGFKTLMEIIRIEGKVAGGKAQWMVLVTVITIIGCAYELWLAEKVYKKFEVELLSLKLQ